MKTSTNHLLLGASLAALLAPPALARAADAAAASETGAQVETLIVTASKRAEDIQDVPMSVSAFSGAALERAGIVNFSEIARQLPSVQMSASNNNRNTTVLVRGIGSSGTNPGIEPSVGIFLDGVFMPAAGPIQSNIQDIASVEVLRGPQGTLYGRNTPVGAINIVTRDPSSSPEAQLTVGAGNYGEYHLQGYVGGAIAKDLNGRVSAWVNSHDGYEKNLFDGSRTNDGEQFGVRGRVKWTPTDDVTGNFIAYYTRLHSHCCTGEQINPTGTLGIATPGFLAAMTAAGHPFIKFNTLDFTVDDETVSNDVTQVGGASAQFDIHMKSGHTLTSITAFNEFYDNIKVLSADGLPIDVGTGPQPLKTLSYSEELRIASPKGQKLEYLAGIYLFRETVAYRNGLTAHAGANRVFPGATGRITPGDNTFYFYDQTTKSEAIFGQATFHLTEALRLTGGLRYSNDEKNAATASADNPGVSAAFRSSFPINPEQTLNRTDHKLTYSLGGQYDIAEHVMAYATVATGFKDGGFNARQTAAGTPLAFAPENSKTYEVGLKSVLFDRRVVVNADVFRMELNGFQESKLNPLTGIGFIVGNAGDRRIDGLEADVRWAPIEHLTIAASGQTNNARFTNYRSAQCYVGKAADGVLPGTCNYNGLRPAFNPKVSGSLSANWDAPISSGLRGFANGSVTWQDKQYEDPTLDPRSLQGAYSLTNLRLGIGSEDGFWKVSIFGKNLGAKAYYIAEAGQPLAGLVSGGGTAAAQGFFGWYGQPRTYGVELTVRR